MKLSFPDFHALRVNLRTMPDEMVHDVACEMLSRAYGGKTLGENDLVWVIESYERRRPKVITSTVSDGVVVRESFG